MKRKDLITKLMNEGLTEKTLVNMSDRQLDLLFERLTISGAKIKDPNVFNNPTIQTLVKDPIKTLEVTEDKKKDTEEEKGKTIKALKYKIQHEKDKTKVADYRKLLDKLEKGKKSEFNEGEFKSKTEWLQSKGILPKKGDKEETKENTDVDDEPKSDKKKEEKKEKSHSKEKEGGPEYLKWATSKDVPSYNLNEWVDQVVEKNIHPFTSKNEIMELIQIKLTEQQTAPITKPTTRPETKPGEKKTNNPDHDDPFKSPTPGIKIQPKAVKPQEDPDTEILTDPDVEKTGNPDHDDPFKSPTPGIKIQPKAKGHQISAEDAKKKIIDMMKTYLN